VAPLHALGPDPSATDRARDVGCPLVDFFKHRPGTRHSCSRRSKTPPAMSHLPSSELEGLLVHRHMLCGHIPLSPPGASVTPSASLLSPAEAPVGAMGLSQPAAAVL